MYNVLCWQWQKGEKKLQNNPEALTRTLITSSEFRPQFTQITTSALKFIIQCQVSCGWIPPCNRQHHANQSPSKCSIIQILLYIRPSSFTINEYFVNIIYHCCNFCDLFPVALTAVTAPNQSSITMQIHPIGTDVFPFKHIIHN